MILTILKYELNTVNLVGKIVMFFKRRLMRKLFFIILLITFNLTVYSQYYVSTTGLDSNSGLTPSQAKKTVKAAILICPAGGTVYMLNGEYSETDIIIQKALTVTKANPSDIVTIKGNVPNSSTHTIFYIKSGKVVLNGLNLKDLIFNNANAIYIESGDSITVRNCTISNIGWTNYNAIAPPTSLAQSVSAIKARNGLPTPITRIYIINNTIFNCSVGYGEGITIDGNVAGFLIDSNTVYNITNPGIDAHGGSNIANQGIYKARNGKIRYNHVYGCMGTIDIAAGIYIDGASNCLVEGNTVHHNGVGISLGAEENTTEVPGDDTIRNNVIYNNSIFGMIVGSNTSVAPYRIKNIEILHNTFFRNRTMEPINGVTAGINPSGAIFGGEISFQSVDNITIQGNNIHRRNDRLIWNIQGGGQKITNCIFKYNNYYRDIEQGGIAMITITNGSYFNSINPGGGTYFNLGEFQAVYPAQETFTSTLNSQFTDTLNRNFKPLSVSQLINAGNPSMNSTLSGLNDINGLQRIICNRIDKGAYELNATTPTPTITPAGILSSCAGTPLVLTSSATSGNQWYLNSVLITGANSATYSASNSGTYSVESVQNGCLSSQSQPVNFSVNPIPAIPSVNPSQNQSICAGQSVLLSSSVNLGNQWYRDDIAIVGATASTYAATLAGIFTVKTTQSSCTSGASNGVSITVNSIPLTPTISPLGTVSVCPSVVVQFTSSSSSGNQWYLNNVAISGATSQTFSTSQTGSYTVKVTNAGCPSNFSSPTVLNNTSTPNPPIITIIGNTAFCDGDSARLISSILSNNQWYLNGIPISNATGSFYQAKVAGSYTVKQNISGCSSSFSNPIVLTVLNNPTLPFITSNGNILKTTSGYTNYTWYLNATPISGAVADNLNAGLNYGSYNVRVFNAAGCSNLSPIYNYQNLVISDSSIIVYGNPVVNNNLKLMFKNYINNEFFGAIYNTIGQRIIDTHILKNGLNSIDISKIPSGFYLIEITSKYGFKEFVKFEILR